MNPIDYAWQELGQTEVPGKADNPRILEYQKHSPDVPDDDEIAWCSDFVGWCVSQAGMEPTHKATARSWENWGSMAIFPEVGDIVVLWRGSPTSWKGHIGFYVGGNAKLISMLGGNQSNRVSVREYPVSRVLSYRRKET